MQWLEYLAPLVFVLVWILSKIFGPKEDQEGDAPRKRSEEESKGETFSEQAREVQEEIRRRIAERQKQQPDRPPPVPSEAREEAPAQREYDPFHSEQERSAPRETAYPKRQAERYRREERPEPASPFSGGLSEIEKQIAEQRRKAEAARRQREEARRKVAEQLGKLEGGGSMPPPVPAAAVSSTATWGLFPGSGLTAGHLGEVRAELRSPSAARRAVILREVLGPPRALDPEGTFRPLIDPPAR